MSNTNPLTDKSQQVLWCLPYDSETFFKQFLKISFTKFLKQLVSNKYFPMYQKQMAKQLYDRSLWGDKCWHLLQFFQYLNQSFQISHLDIVINFIEEDMLRKVIGHFRLWIDLQRLYLFNFLKLDKMQFMDDRIYMSLYRTMMFMYTLFSQYDYDDFHQQFIQSFCSKSIKLIDIMSQYLSKSTKPLAEAIKTILTNFSIKRGNLISQHELQMFKNNGKVKVVQLSQNIRSVEQRLYNNVKYQQKVYEQNKMKRILQMSFIDSLTKVISNSYNENPKKKITQEYQAQVVERGLNYEQKQLQYRLKMYDQQLRKQNSKYTLYQRLQQTIHDPYQQLNNRVYGQLVKIDSSKKQQLQKKQIKEVISKNDDDQFKIYYQQDYIVDAQRITRNSAKVTHRDLAKHGISTMKSNTKQPSQSATDDKNKIFNLRYTYQENPTTRLPNTKRTERDFDNNILFKNQIDQFIQNSKTEMVQRLAANKCHTKTFMECKNKLEQIFPEGNPYSFGADLYSNRTPLFFSVNKLKTLNRNKFDQMRKIINYMTAQKKIKNLILEKNIPQNYPRNFQDIKTLIYNPLLFEHKINFCNGKSVDVPEII